MAEKFQLLTNYEFFVALPVGVYVGLEIAKPMVNEGYAQYNNAQNQISTLKSQIHSINYTESLIPKNNSAAISALNKEVAVRQTGIYAAITHQGDYKPALVLEHGMEAVGSAVLALTGLSVATRYYFRRHKQNKVKPHLRID